MKTINQIFLVGRVGQPPQVKQRPGGVEVARFPLATDRRVRDGEGWSKTTDWHTIVAFDHAARLAAQYVKKGDAVAVVGDLRYERWEDDDGNPRRTANIVARSLTFFPDHRSKPSLATYDPSAEPEATAAVPF
ncbi:MAG: single-stranded DNA-binding protein [Alphaproteobacteria bacterium]|nr:single-stranded DNA-binding protein [Alphaproteobacteria bacterium]